MLTAKLVTVEIINLYEGQEGIKVHSNSTVVSEQLNTGKAVFDLPKIETLRLVYNKTDFSIYFVLKFDLSRSFNTLQCQTENFR